MPAEPIPTHYFVLIVVHREDYFLLTQENRQNKPWSLPGGRVEPGEMLLQAAQRETLEETGLKVKFDGIVRVEHTLMGDHVRMRVIFTARPVDDAQPKSEPDEHSLRAAWATLEDLDKVQLRGNDVRRILEYVANGGRIYPMSLLTHEGAPFPEISR